MVDNQPFNPIQLIWDTGQNVVKGATDFIGDAEVRVQNALNPNQQTPTPPSQQPVIIQQQIPTEASREIAPGVFVVPGTMQIVKPQPVAPSPIQEIPPSQPSANYSTPQSVESGINSGLIQKPFVSSNINSLPFVTSGQPGPTGAAVDMGLIAAQTLKTGDIGKAWDAYSLVIMRGTPIAVLPDTSKIKPAEVVNTASELISTYTPGLKPYVSSKEVKDVITFGLSAGQEVYERSRTHPIESLALFAVPGAFALGEAKISQVIGSSAISKIPAISTVGRALSTPLATDIGQYGVKSALVVPWLLDTAKNIYEAPNTPEGKGKAVGELAYQLGWMKAGNGLVNELNIPGSTNSFYGKGFFSGKDAPRPVKNLIGDITIGLSSLEMKARGLPGEAQYLTNKWELGKITRFMEPSKNNARPLDTITDVPIEHRAALESAITSNVALGYGSGFSYGQLKPSTRAVDLRLKTVDVLQSDAFRNARTMSEQVDIIRANQPEFGSARASSLPKSQFPVSAGADVDLFGNSKGIKMALATNEGAILGIRYPGNEGVPKPYTLVKHNGVEVKVFEKGYVKPTPSRVEYMSTAAAERIGIKFDTTPLQSKRTGEGFVENIYFKGAKFAIDIHEVPRGFPELRGSKNYKPNVEDAIPETWRTPLAFKLLGNPFESIPRYSDVMYIGERGGTKIQQEKVGFQTQRLGDAMAKNLMSGYEKYEADPLFRGYRYEKDLYRDVSTTQSLLSTERGRIARAQKNVDITTRETNDLNARIKRLNIADALVKNTMDINLKYTTTRGEEPSIGKVSNIMKIGEERLGWGMNIAGNEIGPSRTTIGKSKLLSEYPLQDRRDIVSNMEWEKKFIPSALQSKQPQSLKIKPVEGKLLQDIPYERKSLSDQLKKYKAEPVSTTEEPLFTSEFKLKSPSVEEPASSKMFLPKLPTLVQYEKKKEEPTYTLFNTDNFVSTTKIEKPGSTPSIMDIPKYSPISLPDNKYIGKKYEASQPPSSPSPSQPSSPTGSSPSGSPVSSPSPGAMPYMSIGGGAFSTRTPTKGKKFTEYFGFDFDIKGASKQIGKVLKRGSNLTGAPKKSGFTIPMPAPIKRPAAKKAASGGSFIPMPQPIRARSTVSTVPRNNIPGGSSQLNQVTRRAPIRKKAGRGSGWTMNTNTRSL